MCEMKTSGATAAEGSPDVAASAVILQIKMLGLTEVKSDIPNKPLSCQTWTECNQADLHS